MEENYNTTKASMVTSQDPIHDLRQIQKPLEAAQTRFDNYLEEEE